jgi:hypothetical protein
MLWTDYIYTVLDDVKYKATGMCEEAVTAFCKVLFPVLTLAGQILVTPSTQTSTEPTLLLFPEFLWRTVENPRNLWLSYWQLQEVIFLVEDIVILQALKTFLFLFHHNCFMNFLQIHFYSLSYTSGDNNELLSLSFAICLQHYIWGLVKDIWDCVIVTHSLIHVLNVWWHFKWMSCCIPNVMVVNYLHQCMKPVWNEHVTFLCVLCMKCMKWSMVGILFVCVFLLSTFQLNMNFWRNFILFHNNLCNPYFTWSPYQILSVLSKMTQCLKNLYMVYNMDLI